MNAAAILEALLSIAPQLFTLVQTELTGGPAVTDAQVQALFTAYGVEESTAAALVASLKAQGK
jgi:hypothetical protein